MEKIVYKVEPGMDRKLIKATTYQMRNFYRQFGDGFFGVLDVMNYIQHQAIVQMARKGDHVLDVCCGRGLLLPMLRYERKNIASYTGVDIEPKNAIWQTKRVTDNKPIEKDYYPFETKFIRSNVATMSPLLQQKYYNLVVYTSSIEHMQKADGYKSLQEIRKIIHPDGTLVLTCPNTPEHKDGYDTQYAAHVYEWKRSELLEAFQDIGYEIQKEYSILTTKQDIKNEVPEIYKKLEGIIPTSWIIGVLSPLVTPIKSKEIAFILKPLQNNAIKSP